MKVFLLLFLVMFLVSCGANTPVVEETQTDTDETQMQEEIDNLEMSEEDMSKVETINYSYTNPAQEVNMKIEYSLDENNTIQTLDITSDNWDKLGDFNTAAKEKLVGMTLEQASEVGVISGSSLTTEAFKEAIKTQL